MTVPLSLPELEARAADFVRGLSPETHSATVVTLAGELGAGKTAFVKAAARALGVTEPITSPTFVLMKRYELRGQSFANLIHIDAYRIKDARELNVLGWQKLLANRENLMFLEWPERVGELVPPSAHRVTLSHIAEDRRGITIS